MASPLKQKTWSESHPEYTSQEIQVGNRKYTAFSPQRKTERALFNFYADVVNQAVKAVERTAIDQLKKGPSASPIFRLPARMIQQEIDSYKNPFAQPPPDAKGKLQMKLITDLTGLKRPELQAQMNLAKVYASEFFSKDCYFSYGSTEQQVRDELVRMGPEIHNFLFDKMKMERSAAPLSFTEENFKDFGVKKEEVTADPQRLSCLRFALLTAKELKAKELIFQEPKDDQAMLQLFEHLPRWGYQSAAKPAPGDLVVYVERKPRQDQKNPDYVPDHVGVYLGENRVISKIGVVNPYSHTHSLFDTQYMALFFRKEKA